MHKEINHCNVALKIQMMQFVIISRKDNCGIQDRCEFNYSYEMGTYSLNLLFLENRKPPNRRCIMVHVLRCFAHTLAF